MLVAPARPDLTVRAAVPPALRIVGPSGETTPVVNERGKTRLSVVDGGGQQVAVQSWSSDSLDVAKVTRKGVLKGRQYGFATVTARTATGEVTGFVVVVRVSDRPGARAQGDTKEDRSGNVYLSSPKQNVIYRTMGGQDEVFAGQAGRPGYEDGPGDRAQFDTPTGLGIDNRAEGGLYVADTANHCIRRVDFEGRATTALGRAQSAGMMALDVTRIEAAAMTGPRGVASVGRNFFFTDTGNHAIYYGDFGRGEVVLVAGQPGESGLSNGGGREARFSSPGGLAINTRGDLLAVADTGNDVVRLVAITRTPDGRVVGEVTTLGQATSARGARRGDEWLKDRDEDRIAFDRPTSVGLDGIGNVYVIDATGASVVTREAGRRPERQSLAQAGSLGRPASVSVSGTRTLVLDEAAKSARRAVKTVEVGAPEITSLSANVDRIDGGREVIVEGRNFARESRLTLGDAEVADYEVLTARKIRFVVPPQQAPGGRTLSVITRGGVAQRQFNIRLESLAEIAPGESTTVVGGAIAYVGDGGLGTNSRVGLTPQSVAVDGAGNVFVADERHNRVRRLDATTGVIATIAGNGQATYSGDGGLATNAGLSSPRGVAVDGAGNVYIADTANHRVRRVDALTGLIATVAGDGTDTGFVEEGIPAVATSVPLSKGCFVDAAGNLFIANPTRIRRVDAATGIITTVAGNGLGGFSGDGGPAVEARIAPAGVVGDHAGNLFIADTLSRRIRRVDAATGTITTFAGGGNIDLSTDGVLAAEALLFGPTGLTIDGSGDLIFADGLRVFRIDAATTIITAICGTGNPGYSGDGGPAVACRLGEPVSVAVDGVGNVSIADLRNNRVRQVSGATGLVSTIAGNGSREFDGVGEPATSAAISPEAVAIDSSGNMFFGDLERFRVYRVDAVTGEFSVVAGSGSQEPTGDGGPATLAGLYVKDLAVDASGNLFIADSGNNRVRRVDAVTGIITTVAGDGTSGFAGDGGPATAASFNEPTSVVVDAAANLFVADYGNHRVRRVDAVTKIITTVAGNGTEEYGGDGVPATSTGMPGPYRIALDRQGNLCVIDLYFYHVRRVDLGSGIVTTLAGNGVSEYTEDGVPAISTGLDPADVAFDSANGLFVADLSNGRVRRVDAATNIITTAIRTVDVQPGGKKHKAAPIDSSRLPRAVALDGAGNVFFADETSVRVLKRPSTP